MRRQLVLIAAALLLLGSPGGVLPAWCQDFLALSNLRTTPNAHHIILGNSVSAGSDGNETGVAEFGSPCSGNLSAGIFTLLACYFGNGVDVGFGVHTWVHEATAGKGSTHTLERFVTVADANPTADDLIYSMHVNDCGSLKCGCVCNGGTQDGIGCEADENCPGGGNCENTTGGDCTNPGGGGTGISCSADQTRQNVQAVIDEALSRDFTVTFWKSPCHVNRLEQDTGTSCAGGTEGFVEHFNHSPSSGESLQTLFTDDTIAGYPTNPAVAYLERAFQVSCDADPSLQACNTYDAFPSLDQREWLFAHDLVSQQRRGNFAGCHPNPLGYRELAEVVCRSLRNDGQPCDLRPEGRPTISFVSADSSSITVDVTAAGPDPDAGAHAGTDAGLETIVWAVCGPDMDASADLTCHGACSGEGGFPCNGNTDAQIGGAWLERECGTRFAADRNGDGQRDEFVFTGSGTSQVTITGLSATTDYKLCAVTLGDRYLGSRPTELRFVTTGS